jgi:hypothetical protein
MDYPQRNTDAAKKYGLERENADSGRGRPLPLMGELAVSKQKKGNCYLQQPVNRRKHRLLQVLGRTGLKHEEKQVYGLLFNPSSFLAWVQRV